MRLGHRQVEILRQLAALKGGDGIHYTSAQSAASARKLWERGLLVRRGVGRYSIRPEGRVALAKAEDVEAALVAGGR